MNKAAENEALFARVLLIEDDSSHSFLISRALSRYCREILHANSLGQGKQLVLNSELDLIVTDLNLPDSSRALSVKVIKELSQDTPVIALTSSSLIQDAVEAMKHGAADFIVKDFGPDFSDILGLALARVAAARGLRAEKEKLQAEMQALRSAIENSPEGMAVADSQGNLSYWNKAFQEFATKCGGNVNSIRTIFGAKVAKNEQMTSNLQEKFHNMQVNSAWSTEISLTENYDALGSRTYEINLSILEGGSGRTAVLWLKDISSLKRREKFQRDMLATTTHDLKNPLAAISVSAELLIALVKENKRASDIVLRIGSSSQSAINMIDEFLSARRIKEGSFILKPTEVSVVEAIQSELDNFTASIAAKQQVMEFRYDKAPQCWHLDRLGIQRVFTNLMSNAIKFTPKGGQISVCLEARSGELHLVVSDGGCGMEPSEVQKIFERFSRLDRHSEFAGSGLGLFVVKSIVNAHGGRIDVTSQVGKGTSFEVVLPKDPPVNERGELISLDFTA